MNRIIKYLRGTRAVAAMEYALIVGIIIVGLAAALTTFRGQIENVLTNAGKMVQGQADKLT